MDGSVCSPASMKTNAHGLSEMGGGRVDNEFTTVFSYIYIYSETVGGARERKLQENSTEIAVLLSAALKSLVNNSAFIHHTQTREL